MLFAIAMSLAIGCSIAGDFLLRQGATAVKGPRGDSLSSIFSQSKTILGICLMTIHFGSFLLAIRLAPITIVVPLMASTYIVNTLLAGTVLKERVNWLRWVGVMVIVVGVVVLGLWS